MTAFDFASVIESLFHFANRSDLSHEKHGRALIKGSRKYPTRGGNRRFQGYTPFVKCGKVQRRVLGHAENDLVGMWTSFHEGYRTKMQGFLQNASSDGS
ncbi:hypothetical protein TNIN_64621 [Trichonephila inaurata madagascariensis]|uniref:Uncharacterized protein n=1 Tax=Trichonephila inaurata madagascariensis TaxID=2747483 RepID=A0A8X6X472_9ARAC|nr:hypothetical protein TNIN_64621 [Trichonephila inaurata madagascariensis]